MKIIDISQEIFNCKVFPGDNSPKRNIVSSMEKGSMYNLTEFYMCAHNGTHIDAPFHFYKEGKTVDKIPLENFIGKCFVTFFTGDITEEDAKIIVEKAKSQDKDSAKRILIGGKAVVTLEAAKAFSKEELLLIGNESQTVGPEDAPAKVHLELLKNEVVLLEGIRLNGVEEGVYLLNALPINLGGSDGAPCRAVLISEN